MLRQRKRTLKKHEFHVNDPVFWVFTKKEIVWGLFFVIVGSFISFVPIIPNDDPVKIFTTFLVFFIIITVWMATKKITAYHFAIKIEHSDWKLTHWWWFTRAYFRKPLPLGLIAPFFLAIFTIGFLKPFAFLQFDYVDIPARRLLKKHGPRQKARKEAINEQDPAYTAASGMYALLILALIGVMIKPFLPAFGADLAKYSIYYGIWNLLPAGQLDGTKIFFGTTVLWSFLVLVYFISFLFVFI